MSVTTETTSGLRQGTPAALEVEAADRDQWDIADAPLPFADAREPLRRKSHHLQDRRIDRAKRDIIGLEAQRALEFRVVMRADADAQPARADRVHVGAVEIALPEMDAVGAGVDRDPPVVVDHKLRVSLATYLQRLARLAENLGVGALLDP